MNELIEAVERAIESHGWHASPRTLMLGAMEEMGELAQAINMLYSPDFIASPGKHLPNVAHEVGDVITYLLHLSIVLGVKPVFGHLDYEVGDE